MPVEVNQFIYGNSLVNFAGGSFESNVPYWMGQFAEAAGNTYNANGGYGFLRQFADREEPGNEWGFQGVDGVWDTDTAAFSDVAFDSVMITPANFIQDRAPDDNYAGEDRSPLDATIDVVRDTLVDQPGAQIFIYEGWADLGTTFGFPVSESELDQFHAYNAGEYHDWYVEFTDGINAAVPEADVQLIPVASIMADLFTDGPLAGLTLDDLYVDSAPHGTETVYFLASMITYPATYGEAVPADFEIPDTINPLVADNFDVLYTRIDELLSAGSSEPVDEQPTDPDAEQPTDPVEEELVDPDTEEPVDPVSEESTDPAEDEQQNFIAKLFDIVMTLINSVAGGVMALINSIFGGGDDDDDSPAAIAEPVVAAVSGVKLTDVIPVIPEDEADAWYQAHGLENDHGDEPDMI